MSKPGVEALREQVTLADREDRPRLYLQLTRLGHLLDREDWFDEGVEQARQALSGSSLMRESSWQYDYAVEGLVELLAEKGRFAEAEALLIDQVSQTAKLSEGDRHGADDAPREALIRLAGVYGEADRWADVLVLLERAPYWGAADLAKLYTEEEGEHPLGYLAAKALAEADRDEDAARVAVATLHHEPGHDPLYALLTDLQGQGATDTLNALFERDRFEERPLIWRAKLELEAGETEKAHETIRQAIAIDPSDGEQGPGDRMRAYAVLADILDAKGDAETATVMRGAVRAIRLSEDADRYYAAGLLSMAVDMYEEALTHFADAYCIQSRLAIQLAELGRYDEAAEHYRRAFELMPDSFGRVESHCFGCEGAFSGEQATSIAEQVFSQLRVSQPLDPQVHYLTGYLASSRDRDQEALASFRMAVQLDPEYLNAWKRIVGLASSLHIPKDRQDEAALQIFRLDPLGRHSSADLAEVSDIEQAWQAVAAAQPLAVPQPETLLPLPAAAAQFAEDDATQSAAELRVQRSYIHHTMRDDEGLPTPGEMLSRHTAAQAAATLAALAGQ